MNRERERERRRDRERQRTREREREREREKEREREREKKKQSLPQNAFFHQRERRDDDCEAEGKMAEQFWLVKTDFKN